MILSGRYGTSGRDTHRTPNTSSSPSARDDNISHRDRLDGLDHTSHNIIGIDVDLNRLQGGAHCGSEDASPGQFSKC